MRLLCTLISAFLFSGCASSDSFVVSEVVGSTTAFDGFPAQSLEGIVYAQAAFDGDYDETFATDLIERGVVPVRVTMQLRGEGQESAQVLIKPGRMRARLYLLDGTALPHVPADRVAAALKEKPARRVRRHAFHGGLIGVMTAMWLYGRRVLGKGMWHVTDFVAPLAPIGLGTGRVGNFINGELWGKPTDLPWACSRRPGRRPVPA